MKNRLKIWLFKQLFTENEKCLLNQAINLQEEEMWRDAKNGHTSDLANDIKDLHRLHAMCANKLWN